jgi:hypothetical protein
MSGASMGMQRTAFFKPMNDTREGVMKRLAVPSFPPLHYDVSLRSCCGPSGAGTASLTDVESFQGSMSWRGAREDRPALAADEGGIAVATGSDDTTSGCACAEVMPSSVFTADLFKSDPFASSFGGGAGASSTTGADTGLGTVSATWVSSRKAGGLALSVGVGGIMWIDPADCGEVIRGLPLDSLSAWFKPVDSVRLVSIGGTPVFGTAGLAALLSFGCLVE